MVKGRGEQGRKEPYSTRPKKREEAVIVPPENLIAPHTATLGKHGEAVCFVPGVSTDSRYTIVDGVSDNGGDFGWCNGMVLYYCNDGVCKSKIKAKQK